ncbi:MAG: SH3 domain-containing protein, partial [Hungatella sp.]
NSACEILGTEGDWYHISSGGVDGYISNQYVISGEEAKQKALEYVKLRAIVTADNLNIRQEPVMDSANIIAQALIGERYEVVGETDGWVQITNGYVSADYVEVRYALNEGRKMDLKAMAINQYDNLVISKVTNYLNIRSTPKDEGNANIIGKFPGKAAGEILETIDGWYKIQSGKITGYVTSDSQYTATGAEAKDLALSAASLMAIVNTDKLNVRKEPSTESTIWTQISKEDRYTVLQQMDGWVQIELDSGEENADAAYIATRDNNVEVRYALEEAIKFSPVEEKANQEASLRSKIVNYALQFVGNRYVWGGTSLTNGADCSGFTQSVMRNFGISLPRVSRDQAKTGKAIDSSQMRPGDLIFYANSGGTINHVAMYIGNGQIVHAASRRSGIKISTWNYRKPARIRNVID